MLVALPRLLMARVPRGRLRNAVVTVAVATVVVAGASLIPGTPGTTTTPPTPGTANVWIDQNGGTCTRQSTAGSYVDAAACSRDGAEAVWQRGDTVLVKGGTTYSGVWVIERNASFSGGTCDPYAEWGTANTSQCV